MVFFLLIISIIHVFSLVDIFFFAQGLPCEQQGPTNQNSMCLFRSRFSMFAYDSQHFCVDIFIILSYGRKSIKHSIYHHFHEGGRDILSEQPNRDDCLMKGSKLDFQIGFDCFIC